MPRYDFVDPYARRSAWNDVGETFNTILDSEARRRQEIEAKRRFDEQTAIQSRYAREAELRGEADRFKEGLKLGPEGITGTFGQSYQSQAMRQGHGQDLERDAFSDTLARGRMQQERNWLTTDRDQGINYLEGLGIDRNRAGAATYNLPGLKYFEPESEQGKAWWHEQQRTEQGNAMKRIGASRGGQGGGGQSTEDFWKWMTHNRARYDDYGNRIGQLERLPVPQRTIDQEVGTPAGDAFTTDSTRTMGGRQREIGRLQAAQDAVGYDMDRGTEGMFPGVSSPRSRTGLTDDEMERALTDRKFYDWLTTKNKVRLEDYAADIEDYRRRRRGR